VTSEQKVALGRPAKLDDKLATEIAALLLAGHSTSEVAQMVGVSRRSIAGWRARAWSRDPRDRACVQLEQMIVRGRFAQLADAEGAQPDVEPSLDELLADLDATF
jgi:hypothetical protein